MVHVDQCHAILFDASVVCSVSGSNFDQTDHSFQDSVRQD